MSVTEYDSGPITRALRLVAGVLGRWGEIADEEAEVFRRIIDALAQEDLDETARWCLVREAVEHADSESGWTHLRMRDDIIGALSGIEDPLPLTGPESDNGHLMGVPEIGDVKPGENCDDV